MVEPFVRAAAICARYTRKPAPAANVRPNTIEGVELRLEELIAAIEGLGEPFFRISDGEELVLRTARLSQAAGGETMR